MLATAFERGRAAALAKFAAVPLARPVPAARGLATPHAPAAAPHPTLTPIAGRPQPGYEVTPAMDAEARKLQAMSHTQRQQVMGLDRDSQNAAFMQQHGIAPAGAPAAATAAAPGMLSRVGAGAQRFMRPLKRGLGLAALGAAGAAAYGLHHQNQEDQAAHDLVYAPMQGSYMQ